jgi:hypothetical protein
MVRLGAIFIALCMVLIAASLGAVLYLRLGFSAPDSALAAVGVLTVLAVYNAVSGRRRDRAVVNDQLASLARGSGDLARQLAEFGRRLATMEEKAGASGTAGSAANAATQPLAGEIEELSRLVRQLAESVAQHEIGRCRAPMRDSWIRRHARLARARLRPPVTAVHHRRPRSPRFAVSIGMRSPPRWPARSMSRRSISTCSRS